MFPIIQTEPFKKLLYLWPEKAIRLLFDNYYDALTYIAQRHTRDIHKAEEVVQFTLADLWFRHREKKIDKFKSVQHYLVITVKQRARKVFAQRAAWYRKNGLEPQQPIDEATDEEDVRLILENPPMQYDKFDFDQSIFYCWRSIEYILYPWVHYRTLVYRAVRKLFVFALLVMIGTCMYYAFIR